MPESAVNLYKLDVIRFWQSLLCGLLVNIHFLGCRVFLYVLKNTGISCLSSNFSAFWISGGNSFSVNFLSSEKLSADIGSLELDFSTFCAQWMSVSKVN